MFAEEKTKLSAIIEEEIIWVKNKMAETLHNPFCVSKWHLQHKDKSELNHTQQYRSRQQSSYDSSRPAVWLELEVDQLSD